MLQMRKGPEEAGEQNNYKVTQQPAAHSLSCVSAFRAHMATLEAKSLTLAPTRLFSARTNSIVTMTITTMDSSIRSQI